MMYFNLIKTCLFLMLAISSSAQAIQEYKVDLSVGFVANGFDDHYISSGSTAYVFAFNEFQSMPLGIYYGQPVSTCFYCLFGQRHFKDRDNGHSFKFKWQDFGVLYDWELLSKRLKINLQSGIGYVDGVFARNCDANGFISNTDFECQRLKRKSVMLPVRGTVTLNIGKFPMQAGVYVAAGTRISMYQVTFGISF